MHIQSLLSAEKLRIGDNRVTKAPEIRQSSTDSKLFDDSLTLGASFLQRNVEKPPNEDLWKLDFVEDNNLVNQKGRDILKKLISTSPDFSRAIKDYQLDIVTEINITGNNRVTTNQIQEIKDILTERGESIETKAEKLAYSYIVKGSAFVGLDLGQSGRELINVNVLDAWTARFEKREDPERGQYYQLGQIQNSRFVPLDEDYNIYSGINMGDGPYGRSLLTSAIFPTVYLLNLAKSIREILITQALPVRHFAIDEEIINLMEFRNNDERTKYINDLTDNLQGVLDNIKKNQSIISPSSIKFEGMVGGVNKTNLDIDSIIRILERWIIRAMGTYPIKFGSNETLAESQAQEQLLAYYGNIGSYQRVEEDIWTDILTRIIRSWGNARGIITVSFKRNNAIERKRNAEVLASEIGTMQQMINSGLLSLEQAQIDASRIYASTFGVNPDEMIPPPDAEEFLAGQEARLSNIDENEVVVEGEETA